MGNSYLLLPRFWLIMVHCCFAVWCKIAIHMKMHWLISTCESCNYLRFTSNMLSATLVRICLALQQKGRSAEFLIRPSCRKRKLILFVFPKKKIMMNLSLKFIHIICSSSQFLNFKYSKGDHFRMVLLSVSLLEKYN